MKRDSKSVWYDNHEREVLTSSKPGEFYIPLSTIDAEQLRELGLAIGDALGDPLITAMMNAQPKPPAP